MTNSIDAAIEVEIVAKGLTAPRVTPDRIWVVGDYANQGWFEDENYRGAVAYLVNLAHKHCGAGKRYELSLEDCLYRPAEAQQLLDETNRSLPTQTSP